MAGCRQAVTGDEMEREAEDELRGRMVVLETLFGVTIARLAELAPDPAATIGRLIADREPVYQLADIVVSSRDVPHEKIVEECIALLHHRLCRDEAAGLRPSGSLDQELDEGFGTTR